MFALTASVQAQISSPSVCCPLAASPWRRERTRWNQMHTGHQMEDCEGNSSCPTVNTTLGGTLGSSSPGNLKHSFRLESGLKLQKGRKSSNTQFAILKRCFICTYRGQGKDLFLHCLFFIISNPGSHSCLFCLFSRYIFRHKLLLFLVEVPYNRLKL